MEVRPYLQSFNFQKSIVSWFLIFWKEVQFCCNYFSFNSVDVPQTDLSASPWKYFMRCRVLVYLSLCIMALAFLSKQFTNSILQKKAHKNNTLPSGADWGGLEPGDVHRDRLQGRTAARREYLLPLLRLTDSLWGLHSPQRLSCHRLRLPGPSCCTQWGHI